MQARRRAATGRGIAGGGRGFGVSLKPLDLRIFAGSFSLKGMAGKHSVGFKKYNEFVFKKYKLEIVLMQDHLS